MHNEFDTEELLAFAVKAIETNDYVNALAYAKSASNIEPDNEKVIFLLSAIHAQLGLVDRAIQSLRSLCKKGCKIPEAHFQLGLMYFVGGEKSAANDAWSSLDADEYDQYHYLLDFKDGLIAYENNNFGDCVIKIDAGLKNSKNPSLNKDFLRLRDLAEDKLKNADNKIESKTSDKDNAHVFLSAYKES